MNRYRHILIPLIAASLVSGLGAVANAPDAPADAKDLLVGWVHSWSWDQCVAMKIDAVSDVSGNGKGKVNAGRVRQQFDWRRNHDQMEALGQEWGPNPIHPDKTGPHPFAEIFTQDRWLSAGKDGATGMYWPFWNGRLHTNAGEIAELREQWETSPYHGEFLDGKESWAGGLLFPRAMLADHPRVNDQMETVYGRRCWRVSCSTADGDLTAWIDPARGNTAARYSMDIEQNQKVNGKPLASFGIRHRSLQVDVDRIEKFGSWYIATAGRFKEVTSFQSGLIETITDEVRRNDIKLHPDFEGMKAFTLNVPDGTRVAYDKAPGIPYEIVNRQPRPRVDENDLKELESALGTISPSSTTQPGNSQ
jgi:hypothetical protein